MHFSMKHQVITRLVSFFQAVLSLECVYLLLTCDQASLCFCGGKVRLIQLLDYLSVGSPESGLFSDWSRNKRYLELSH